MLSPGLNEVDSARQAPLEMLGIINDEMGERDRRIQAWYRDRRTVEAHARFTPCCTTWTKITAAMQSVNVAVVELDESMGVIFGCPEVSGLTNNVDFEKQELLQTPRSRRVIFEHVQTATG